jgi:predicted nicotinamide N-methyase
MQQGTNPAPDADEWACPKDWQRSNMGYAERFVDDCVLKLRGGDVVVRVAQAPSARQAAKAHGYKLDKESDPAQTGTTVWDSAVVLSQYLTSTGALAGHAYPSGSANPVALELGAGTGAVSLSLLACGCVEHVTATDIPSVLPFIAHNARRNAGALDARRLATCALRWGVAGDVAALPRRAPFDLIVGSDLIYYTYSEATPHSRALLSTLLQLAGRGTLVFLALSLHHNPQEVESFLAAAAERFTVARLGGEVPEEWRVADILIVRLQLK